YISSIAELEDGSVRTARNMGPDGLMRMWLQVNVPAHLVPFIDAAIESYDVPDFISTPGFVAFSYRTQHRDAKEVADFIRMTARSAEGRIFADEVTNTIYFEESPSDFRRVYQA